MKYELKGVLKCKGRKFGSPPPPHRSDRRYSKSKIDTFVTDSLHLQQKKCHRVSHFYARRIEPVGSGSKNFNQSGPKTFNKPGPGQKVMDLTGSIAGIALFYIKYVVFFKF